MELKTKMRKLLLGVILIFSSHSLALHRCDMYSLEPGEVTPVHYSKAYGNISFLDNQKSGVYIVIHRTDLEVDVFVYLENDGRIHVYMEPGIPRNESTEDFYPCIDRHVKANFDYFKRTCILDLKPDTGLRDKLMEFLNKKPRNMSFYCDCKRMYEVELSVKDKNGNVHGVTYFNPQCFEQYFQDDAFLEMYLSVNSLVENLLDDKTIGKCNWRNLVKNPAQFAFDIYRSENYLLMLSGKDCPAL